LRLRLREALRPFPPSAILTFPLKLGLKISLAVAAQWLIVLPYLAIRASAEDAGYPRIQGVILPVERVLTSHGPPVLADGHAALARALAP